MESLEGITSFSGSLADQVQWLEEVLALNSQAGYALLVSVDFIAVRKKIRVRIRNLALISTFIHRSFGLCEFTIPCLC